jgi:hypothetical protein
MESSGSHFRRPPSRAFAAPRRSRFGPVPAAPLVPPRPARGVRRAARARAGRRGLDARARARRLGAVAFYLVAALVFTGALLALSGREPGVVIGLGLTRFTDAAVADLAHAHALAGLVHALLVGAFALVGTLARRGRFGAMVAGAGLYAVDGLIVLAAHDWIAVGIHTVLLAMMGRGLDAGRRV